jgi:hypothetical protein
MANPHSLSPFRRVRSFRPEVFRNSKSSIVRFWDRSICEGATLCPAC